MDSDSPKTPLDLLLDEESEAISESWAQALHNMNGSSYASRPIEELRITCNACLLAYQWVIQHHDHSRLRRFVTEIVHIRMDQSFDLSEIARAFLVVKAIIRPRLVARYAGDPDVSAFSDDWLRVEYTVDLALLRFTEQYHRIQLARKERQLARASKLSHELARIATHDELTGLYNYRFFNDRLRQEVQRAVRYRHPLALLMGDLDHFKIVNDTYGHQAGNDVLQIVSQTLRGLLRAGDIIARFGGEEIAILLTETPLHEARQVAEKLRGAVAAIALPDLPAVTLSFGVAAHRPTDPDGSALLAAADTALYAAKQAGRNCVRTSDEINPHRAPQPA
jgi:diguanylate cyclase (GGDEF)-like protein